MYIYKIGVLTVNIEFMWRGLETWERRALASLSIRFMPSHINLSCNKICKKQKVI